MRVRWAGFSGEGLILRGEGSIRPVTEMRWCRDRLVSGSASIGKKRTVAVWMEVTQVPHHTVWTERISLHLDAIYEAGSVLGRSGSGRG